MDPTRARHILLCLRYGIGDVVMETPVVETLRRAAPSARITALGAPPAIELLEGDPRIDDTCSAGRWGLTHRWDGGTSESREAIAGWLDRSGHDLLVDVTHAVAAVRDVVRARGLRSLDSDPEAEAAAVAAGRDGVTAIKASVRAGWGLDTPERRLPRLALSPSHRAFATRFLAAHGLADATPVGISPVASLPMKRWPTERFAAVLDWVVETLQRPVLLFVGPQDDIGRAVRKAARHGDRVVSVGPLHLRRVAALLGRCAAFVCNDTGLMHMAAAVGTPTVGLFGPTSPGVYRPPAPHAVAIGGREIECPHRNTASLDPPGCWTSDHCLIAEHSCIHGVGVRSVRDAVREAVRTAPEESRSTS